jgi:hypothetical protein
MKRRTLVTLQISALIAMLGAAGCPTGGGSSTNPVISVLPAAFNFGVNKDEDTFAVQNAGSGVLVWSVNESIDWLEVSPESGSTPVGGPTIVTITVDRSDLDPGTYTEEFSIASSGGTRIISVTMKVSEDPLPPTLAVDPEEVDFDTTDTLIELDVENAGEGTVNWQLTESIPWLTTSISSGATSAVPTTVVVTADRTGLSAGQHTGEIEFTSDGGDITVPVTLIVPGPSPQLTVNPLDLDFGTNTVDVQFTIRNTGTGTLNWDIAETIPWLSLDVTSGSTTNETETITATAVRTGLSADDYNGVLNITSDAGPATVTVEMTVAPSQLVVVPTTLNYGKFATDKLLSVSNGGTGTVNWSISTAGFPAWLSLTPPTSGSVTGETDGVIVSVDRTGQAPGQYSHTFAVTSDAGNVNVTVKMTVAEVPVLTIDTGLLNGSNNPLASVGSTATEFPFTITNSGTGTLNWNIDPEEFPDWLNISPVAGDVQGAEVDTLTITVNRIGLEPGGYSAQIPVTSNGGNKMLEVTMQVPLRAIIGVLPENVDFGLNADTSSVFVGNIGDPGTVLNFIVESDRSWLFLSPTTGTSIGTESVIKDYQTINVSIDRSELESSGGTGTITVYAVDALGEIDPNIEPATITVSVEASELSFQTPLVSTRIPSMLRYTMVMRDVRDEAILVDPLLLTEAFHIVEDGVPIEEPSETTQQVYLQNSTLTAPLSDERIDLRIRTVLLLDYSGSMRDAAITAGTDLQTLYTQMGSQFIDDYFDYFANVERGFVSMAIMEFHDRNASASTVHTFSDDPVSLKNALANITIADNGASAILPAIQSASQALIDADFPYIGFDNADIRAIALFSDGRITTPPGEIQDYIDILVARRARLVPVGWGVEVNHEPLARLASTTGGHYYLTKPDVNDLPSVPNFSTRIGDLNRDLASHTVLSYVTLGEEESVPIRFDGAFDIPSDTPDLGLVQGTLEEQNINLAGLVGDILMGQISMRTTGVQSNATQVTLRADYVPRNVNKFQFTVTSTEAFGLPTIVPHDQGGLVEGWTLTPLGGGVYSLTSPTPSDVLPYGSYGDLVRLNFASVGATPFTVNLTVDNTIYSGDTHPKYFIFPGTIAVGTEPFLAPALPTPNISPSTIAFGTATNSANLTLSNIGGTYPPSGTPTVLLEWEVDDMPVFVSSVTPDAGEISSGGAVSTALITIDRSLPQGAYSGLLNIAWTTGDLGNEGTWPVLLTLTIEPPVLETNNVGNLLFGNVPQGGGNVTATFDITNTGQSTLDWAIDAPGLPAWIQSILPASGTAINGEIDQVSVTVNPTAVAPGAYNTSFDVVSDGGTDTISVTVTIDP